MNFLRYAAASSLLAASATAADPPKSLEFNRDVRPILADHCFQCHGPDAAQRKGDLRLDVAPSGEREGTAVIVAGQPDKSELWRRVNSTDPDEQMPPPEKGRRLTDAERATLRQWILAGGKFEKHWSLVPVRRPFPPEIQNSEFRIQNSIDSFVTTKLVFSGLHSSPSADKPTLLRRASFALTGLPPSIDEIETFLADNSPDAYEKTVDRLLASPRYGERMAVPWLDAARYADTSGYQSDGERHMWRWRDWVLDALNANMTFDQFTIEQIAGDLLPNATLDQKIATGFNRNHRGNAEGGIIPEEYAAEYVADRVETTSTVWLGLTLGCCRCHDHKYDPFTQRDFYSLFAFFNNIREKGRAIKIGNSPPYIQAPTRLQSATLVSLFNRDCAAAERNYEQVTANLSRLITEWQASVDPSSLQDWSLSNGMVVHLPLDDSGIEACSGRTTVQSGNYRFVAGKFGQGLQFDDKASVELSDAGDFGFFDKFTLAAWVKVPESGDGTIISKMANLPEGEGYQFVIANGKLQLNLVKRWLDDAIRVETEINFNPNEWYHVAASYDGSRVAEGVKLFVDGAERKVEVLVDELNQTFSTKEPLRVGSGGGPTAEFHGMIDDVRIFARALTPAEIEIVATTASMAEIASKPEWKQTRQERLKVRACYMERYASAEVKSALNQLIKAYDKRHEFAKGISTVMVMEEMPTPRETHILLRGQYDKPGDRVQPNVPAELPPLSSASSPNPELRAPSPPANPNRLDLARWLVSSENPLTSRVIVNRAWQLHFGTGLVKTSEDFGRQGEWPSHLELLNWLAAEFKTNWNVKRLHRTIVTSATYRQSSTNSSFSIQNSEFSLLNPEPRTLNPPADPDNRLLTRGPRLRLSAEMVRDQALFTSGQLVEQIGGLSVKPLQPPGLWSELTGGDDYKPGQGADLVRRSLYTFWKRTIPPPTLSTFDSPTREACTVRDSRTNTPLQALALLNEPTFVDASRALANRIIQEATTPRDRITRATLHILNRPPTPPELELLTANLNRSLQRHSTDELAAYTLLCTTLLNLDEAINSQ